MVNATVSKGIFIYSFTITETNNDQQYNDEILAETKLLQFQGV